MKVRELAELIEQLAPLSYACEWDNPGLVTGDPGAEVRTVYLAFDPDLRTVKEAAAVGADFLLTHHPLLFSGVKNLCEDRPMGEKIRVLMEHHIAAYGAHTSFDAAPGCMADLAALRLGLSDTAYLEPAVDGGIGAVGTLPYPMTARELAAFIKARFALPYIELFSRDPDGKKLSRLGVLPGSGGEEWQEAAQAGAEVYLSGDLKHHQILDAMDAGLAVLDAGHYGLEWIFMEKMEKYLEAKLPADVRLLVQPVHFPGECL